MGIRFRGFRASCTWLSAVATLLWVATVQAQPVPTLTVQRAWSVGAGTGHAPQGALLAVDGGSNLVGTMTQGGPFGKGTVYRVGIDGTGFTLLHAFQGSDGANPERALARGDDGWWYGVAGNGGAFGVGSVFRVAGDGSFELLHSFSGGGATGTGSNPNGPLVWADGAWWGTTHAGGKNGGGTLFSMTPTGTVTVRYAFSRSDGYAGHRPRAGLTRVPDGRLWGTTTTGAAGGGSIFAISTAGVLEKMHDLDKSTEGVAGRAALTVASDGNMYLPTTERVLRVALDGDTEALGYNFVRPATLGQAVDPSNATLWSGPDGMLYGTAVAGGRMQQGAIFRILPGRTVSVLHDFAQGTGTQPNDALVLGADGALYTSATAGAQGGGTLVRLANWTASYAPALAFANATSIFNEGKVAAVSLPLSKAADNGFVANVEFGGTAQLGKACETTGVDAVVNVLPTRVGDIGARVHVRTCADRFAEGDETITMALRPHEAYSQGAQAVHVLTIPANAASARVMRFDAPSLVAYEGDGVQLRVGYSDRTAAPVAPLFTARGDAKRGLTCGAAARDFTARPRYAPAGATSSTIAVHMCSDSVLEPDKPFSINLQANNLYGVDAQSTVAITLKDAPPDPRPTMTFDDGHVGLVEGEPARLINLNLSQPATREVVFNLQTGGSAKSGKCNASGHDYQVKRTVRAMPGDTVVRIEVRACADNLVEGHEAGDISVEANADYRLGAYGSTRLEISDVL